MNDILVRQFVPRVEDALDWYQAIGFEVLERWEEEGCGVVWAQVTYAGAVISMSPGGKVQRDRGIKLFLDVDDVDAEFARISDKVDVVYPPTDQFYGRRDFEFNDLNGFTLVYGQDAD